MEGRDRLLDLPARRYMSRKRRSSRLFSFVKLLRRGAKSTTVVGKYVWRELAAHPQQGGAQDAFRQPAQSGAVKCQYIYAVVEALQINNTEPGGCQRQRK